MIARLVSLDFGFCNVGSWRQVERSRPELVLHRLIRWCGHGSRSAERTRLDSHGEGGSGPGSVHAQVGAAV